MTYSATTLRYFAITVIVCLLALSFTAAASAQHPKTFKAPGGKSLAA